MVWSSINTGVVMLTPQFLPCRISGYTCSFPIIWTSYSGKDIPLSRVLVTIGNYTKKKKLSGLSQEIFQRPRPKMSPLSREKGNTHAFRTQGLCIRGGWGISINTIFCPPYWWSAFESMQWLTGGGGVTTFLGQNSGEIHWWAPPPPRI